MLKTKNTRDEKSLFYRAVREERKAVQLGRNKKAARKSANQNLMREAYNLI